MQLETKDNLFDDCCLDFLTGSCDAGAVFCPDPSTTTTATTTTTTTTTRLKRGADAPAPRPKLCTGCYSVLWTGFSNKSSPCSGAGGFEPRPCRCEGLI